MSSPSRAVVSRRPGDAVTHSAALIGTLLLALAALLGVGQRGPARLALSLPRTEPPPSLAVAQPPAPVPTRIPTPECTGQLISPSWPSGLVFTDSIHGWMQGWICSEGHRQSALSATADGGQTWRVLHSPWMQRIVSNEVSQTLALRFISPLNGYLLGEHLLATHDAGETWAKVSALDNLIELEAVGDSIWAIQGPCRDLLHCEFRLLTSSDAGTSWQLADVQPPIIGGWPRLVRVGSQTAWIISVTGKSSAALLATADGGATWQDLPIPCSGFEAPPDMAAVDAAHLWLLCSGMPGAGSQAKWLYVSSDGGRGWRLIADPLMAERPPFGNLFIYGYVRDLVAVSDERAFIGLGRGPLMMTRDGGLSWEPTAVPNVNDSGIWQVLFADDQHGWATTQTDIWRTTDGGDTWERLVP